MLYHEKSYNRFIHYYNYLCYSLIQYKVYVYITVCVTHTILNINIILIIYYRYVQIMQQIITKKERERSIYDQTFIFNDSQEIFHLFLDSLTFPLVNSFIFESLKQIIVPRQLESASRTHQMCCNSSHFSFQIVYPYNYNLSTDIFFLQFYPFFIYIQINFIYIFILNP